MYGARSRAEVLDEGEELGPGTFWELDGGNGGDHTGEGMPNDGPKWGGDVGEIKDRKEKGVGGETLTPVH